MLFGLSALLGLVNSEREAREERLGAVPRSAAHTFTVHLRSVTHTGGHQRGETPRQTVAFPFSTEKRRGRIRIWILIIWIFAVTVAVSSLILSRDPLNYSTCRYLNTPKSRALHADSFDAYVLIPIWSLSVILIAVNYLRTFVAVKQHANKIFESGVQPRLCVVTRISSRRLNQSSALEPGGGEGTYPCSAPEIVGAVCVLSPKAKALGKAKVEGKLAKRLGYIIATVVLCWMPLVLLLTLRLVVDCSECCVSKRTTQIQTQTIISSRERNKPPQS